MKKTIHNTILLIIIISILNGAFFNRIGSKIAEKPYLILILNKITATVFGQQQGGGVVVTYSKRVMPNNLPANPTVISFLEGIIYYPSRFDTKSIFGFQSIQNEFSFYQISKVLSKVFLDNIFKPPS